MRAAVLAAAFAMIGSNFAGAQMHIEPTRPNTVDTIRDSEDFLLLANLFPQAGPEFNPDVESVMAADQIRASSAYLTEEFDVQKATVDKQRLSVEAALITIGVRAIKPTGVDQVHLTFEDDTLAWSTTISPLEIRLGARFLRGLVLGSLRESVTGTALFSQSLGSFLGATPGSGLENTELERRTRLYFAAARNGRPDLATDADFDEHFRASVALLDRIRGTGGEAAVYAELERRLKAAAGGGEISGADGMAMFDVFLQLSFHFRPALMFVMSHELGHVALGHAPFPPDLTCEAKRQRENDADAFALALLVYDIPGDTEAEERALYALGAGDPPNADDERLGYGYAHAVRYGFALGGLTNQIDSNCSYLSTELRINHLDDWRSRLMVRRVDAYQQALRSFSDAPPYVYSDEDSEDLSVSERSALARRLYTRCRSGLPPRNIKLRKLDVLPFGSVVACPNPLPAMYANPDFRLRLGVETAREITEEYRQHIPVVMSDVTLKALQQRNQANR